MVYLYIRIKRKHKMKKALKKFQPVDLVLVIPSIVGIIYSIIY